MHNLGVMCLENDFDCSLIWLDYTAGYLTLLSGIFVKRLHVLLLEYDIMIIY